MTLAPVDPTTLSVDELRERVRMLLDDPSLAPDDPVADDEYRCAVCLRVFKRIRPESEVLAEMEERFGPLPPGEDPALICDNCDAIIGREMGFR